MPEDPGSAELALRKLAQSTEKVSQAADSSDWSALETALGERERGWQSLRDALAAGPLEELQLARLQQVVRRGEEAIRRLLVRRETARSQIGELETERLLLALLAPQRYALPTEVDVRL